MVGAGDRARAREVVGVDGGCARWSPATGSSVSHRRMNESRHVACYGGWGDLAVRIDDVYGPDARTDFLAAMTAALEHTRSALAR